MPVVVNTLKNKYGRAVRNFGKNVGATPSFEDYILGSSTGEFHPSEDRALWIVRRDNDAPEEYVPWLGLSMFPVIAGTGLKIGWFDGQRGIYAPNVRQMVAAGQNPNTGNTGDKRLYGWFSKEGYPNLIAKAIGTLNTPSTLIMVEAHSWIDEAHVFHAFRRAQVDLDSYIPGTGLQRLVLISLKTDLTLDIQSGSTRSTGIEVFPSHFQEIITTKPARAIPIAVYRLANNQTSITEADKLMDMRELLHVQIPPRHNFAATTNPTVNDDADLGYGIGSQWVNVSTDTWYYCLDVTNGAAVWQIQGGSVGGQRLKETVRLATAAALPSVTYANGTSGVGATLTATANGALTIDGVAVSANDRILVKNQSSGLQNGIYTVTNAGSGGAAFVLTRTTDADSSDELLNSVVYARAGTLNANSDFFCTNTATIVLGTDAIAYAGTLVAGVGLAKAGNTMSLALPIANRRLTSNQTIPDGYSLVVSDYFDENGFTLTLQGDAMLEIL